MSELALCALCPRLCRPACPVVTGSHRTAAVPSMLAAALFEWERGNVSPEVAAEAATLCTDCGACEDWCHLHRPLPQLLREARTQLLPDPLVEPLRPVEGQGEIVVVEADGRPMAEALSKRLGKPVRRWFTADRLGVAAVEHADWPLKAAAIRATLADAGVVVIADGGVARALEAAQVPFKWLHELLPDLAQGHGSCAMGGGGLPLACCGAGGPLHQHHPEEARQVGKAWLERASTHKVLDARCRNHLLACGGIDVADPLDALLEELG